MKWKMVPVEPSEEMVAAGFRVHPCAPGESKVSEAYSAMVAAAPLPEAPAPRDRLDAIRAAFEFMLRHQFSAAERSLAQAQTMVFGLRPWTPGLPTKDVLGNAIVFNGSDGMRYTVREVRPSGAYLRVLLGGMRDTELAKQFEVWAPDSAEASNMVDRWVASNRLRDVVLESASLPGRTGWIGLRYSYGGSLD